MEASIGRRPLDAELVTRAALLVALVALALATMAALGATPALAEAKPDDVIKDTDVDWQNALKGTGPGYWITKWLWGQLSSFLDGLRSVVSWVLGILDKSMTALFLEDFSGDGHLNQFYLIARKVSDHVAIPFGTAFLGVVFGIALVQTSDPRHRRQGAEWMQGFLGVVLMFALSWTLIYHAMDLCGMVYSVANNLVRWLNENLGVGGGGAGAQMATAITDSLRSAMDQVTYGGFGMSLLIILLGFVAVIASVGCVFYVMSAALLRIGEVYLRASVSAMCMAFLASDSTRSIGTQWIRKFCAVCLHAGLIIVALNLAGLLFAFATGVVGPLVSDPSASDINYMAAIFPCMIALFSMTGLVKVSERVANGVFGVALEGETNGNGVRPQRRPDDLRGPAGLRRVQLQDRGHGVRVRRGRRRRRGAAAHARGEHVRHRRRRLRPVRFDRGLRDSEVPRSQGGGVGAPRTRRVPRPPRARLEASRARHRAPGRAPPGGAEAAARGEQAPVRGAQVRRARARGRGPPRGRARARGGGV